MKSTKLTLRSALASFAIYVAAVIVVLWTVLPLSWMFLSSITPTVDLLTTRGRWISSNLTFERYASIFSNANLGLGENDLSTAGAVFYNSIKNSILISVATVLLAILLGGIAAYAFARLYFKYKNTLLMATMFFQLLPSITLLIPLYVIARHLSLIDKLPSLVVLYMSFTLPYVIWVMNGYYKTIPPDLETAARIDGCTWFSAYWYVVLPLAKPGLVAVGILAFLMCWDEFIFALVFTTSLGTKTMPVAISEFSTRYGIDYGMVSTAGCIATVFPLLLSLIFQKHIISGLTAGGVKE